MQPDDRIRLQHMVDAGQEAIGFASGLTRADLDSNRMLLLSLVKSVEILGEAANKVSDELRNKYPDFPWREMVPMRNRLIHGYFDINLDILWQTVTKELPPLVTALESILDLDDGPLVF